MNMTDKDYRARLKELSAKIEREGLNGYEKAELGLIRSLLLLELKEAFTN